MPVSSPPRRCFTARRLDRETRAIIAARESRSSILGSKGKAERLSQGLACGNSCRLSRDCRQAVKLAVFAAKIIEIGPHTHRRVGRALDDLVRRKFCAMPV